MVGPQHRMARSVVENRYSAFKASHDVSKSHTMSRLALWWIDALATNIDARVVAVGNPDDPASHFATICKPGSGWHVETISAFDTPAYTGEKVPEELLPLLVSPEWVEERKLRWGVTSPIYQSKVLGEFPGRIR